MSERCSTRACSLLLIFLVSIMSPLASADPVESSENQSFEFTPVFADLDNFVPSDSHPYMLPDSDEALYSATRMMKNTWIDEGMPGVDIATSPQSMTSGRACTPSTKVIQQRYLLPVAQ